MIGLHVDSGAGSGVVGTPGTSTSSSSSPSSRSGMRERTAQAVDYYNNQVLKARVNAGLVGPRASYNDRHHHHHQHQHHQHTSGIANNTNLNSVQYYGPKRHHHLTQDSLYRSNSSLELQDHHHQHANSKTSPTLRREYGSHGSIDVISSGGGESTSPRHLVPGTSESFFAMLQDYRPATLIAMTDQRSPGPSEYLCRKSIQSEYVQHHQQQQQSTSMDEICSERTSVTVVTNNVTMSTGTATTSPKLRLKLHKFWGNNGVRHSAAIAIDESIVNNNNNNATSSNNLSSDVEERQRRRAFAHYDCQSLTANLGYAVKLRGLLLGRRRNTTTGASAASLLNARSSTPDGGENSDEDSGDGQNNELLESCPYFRNEIGGEEERIVSLTRIPSRSKQQQQQQQQHHQQRRPLHRPPLAYGVAVLEFPPGETHWRHATCPYQRLPRPIESVDQGALYYRRHFLGQEHQNWFGMDEQLGPVAISIKREKLSTTPTTIINNSSNNSETSVSNHHQYQYRLVIRTSELLTLRGAILEDAIPNLKTTNNSKSLNTKEVLEYVAPEIQLNCLRFGVQSPQTEEQLLKLDEQGLTSHYKVGIMYCKAGQASEEEMYNNEDAGPAFLEFLECIGQRVRLKGFDKYKAGLDNKTDSTGMYSVYAQYQDCEIMFHVSTMLPFTPNNRQQLLRKRHIGNDIVTIVFQEPGAHPFTPKNIRSQFQHVFIVVRAINPCTENTHYSVAVSRSKEVPVFGPPIKDGALFPKSKTFADFLLAKVVNAENAAHRSEKFATMATRTRQEYLKDLANNYSTTTVIETGQKFSIFSSKKKEKSRPGFISDASQRGAICWQVILDDSGQSMQIECFLGISTDTLVLIEECSRQIVFVTSCKSILGWSAQTNSLRLYHHQGECITIHIRDSNYDRDELMEIVERLKSVTNGILTQELSLRRNPMGQLGFHVQPDGVVTQVESMGLAWQAGLRQGARLVEICKVAVSTLSHDQMVDLLKTSILVTVTVIPPLSDGQPRRGCTLQNCKYTTSNFESDYENVSCNDDMKQLQKKSAQKQQPVANSYRRKNERGFSPPRSSNSSGYGTGSSSKSYLAPDSRFTINSEGTMTSSSSGHSSDDRWYELLETSDFDKGSTPPPLPARLTNNATVFQNTTTSTSSTTTTPTKHHHNTTTTTTSSSQPTAIVQHNKIQVSHSLPLPHANFSLPLNAATQHYQQQQYQQQQQSNSDYEHDYKLALKPTTVLMSSNDTTRPLPRTANIEYLVTRTPKFQMFSSNNDGHSTDTSSSVSDKVVGLPSEDELSAGSGNVSPRSRRRKNTNRNHSPRPGATMGPVNGETRLRPGVTPRSNRNSANLNTSTLQEDLMKLINPDYHPEENLDKNQQLQQPETDVIFTMARPATVISNASTASSPAPSEFKLSKEERLSPRVSNNNTVLKANNKVVNANVNRTPEPLPLPDAGDMDWPSLVDTATRAMLQVTDENLEQNLASDYLVERSEWEEDDVENRLGIDASLTSTVSSSASVPELHSHLTELESRVSLEQKRRKSLEDEVRRLREENKRLQDESQAAAHQLRRFTEWFFQTIDRQ